MISLYNTDAIEWLKTLDNDSVDLIVTDPPYRVQQHGSSGLGGIFKTKTGDEKELNSKLFQHNEVEVTDYASELFRILKPDNHCYVMTNDYNLKNFLNVFAEVGFHFGISSLLAICTATEYMTLTRDKEPLTSQFSSYSSQGW